MSDVSGWRLAARAAKLLLSENVRGEVAVVDDDYITSGGDGADALPARLDVQAALGL